MFLHSEGQGEGGRRKIPFKLRNIAASEEVKTVQIYTYNFQLQSRHFL